LSGAKNFATPSSVICSAAIANNLSSPNSAGTGASGCLVRTVFRYSVKIALSRLARSTLWKCSSRSFFRPANACFSRSACSAGMRQASSLPASSSESSAMKCDLPEPNEPSR